MIFSATTLSINNNLIIITKKTTTMTTSGRRILTRGRIAEADFSRAKVNAGQSGRTVALIPLLILCCVHCSWDLQYFSMARKKLNCSFSLVIWTPSNTWFLGPIRVTHLNGISIGSATFVGHICVINTQTNIQTHTHRPRYVWHL